MSDLPANHGKPWTDAAELELREAWNYGATVNEMMMAFGRKHDAITARLANFGASQFDGHRHVVKQPKFPASEPLLHELLTQLYLKHNRKGRWVSDRFPEPLRREPMDSGGTVTGRMGSTITWVTAEDSIGVRGDQVGKGLRGPELNVNRNIDLTPKKCKVEHVVTIDGTQFLDANLIRNKLHADLLQRYFRRPVDVEGLVLKAPHNPFPYMGLCEGPVREDELNKAISYAMENGKKNTPYIPTGAKRQELVKLKPENHMSIFKSVTTHYVNDNNAAQLSDDELFAQLARGEQQLEKLKSIKTSSKKLAKQIEDMQQQLTELADYIDNRK